jgi:hypothetical protein
MNLNNRLQVERGIYPGGFLETVRMVDRKIKTKREGAYILLFQRDKNTRELYEKRST